MSAYVQAVVFWEQAVAIARDRAQAARERGHHDAAAYLEALASTFLALEYECRIRNGNAPEATTQERRIPDHLLR